MKQTLTLVVLIGLLMALGGLLFLYSTLDSARPAARATQPTPPAPVVMPNQVVLPSVAEPSPPPKPLQPAGLAASVAALPLAAPPPPSPGVPALRWILKDSRVFQETPLAALEPWYVATTAGLIRQFPAGGNNGDQAPPGIPVLALIGSEAAPHFFRLTDRVPHTLRWTVVIRHTGWDRRMLQYSATGFQIIPQPDPNGAVLEADREYTLCAERVGERLTWSLNGGRAAEFEIPADDRTALAILSQRDHRTIHLRSTKLEFAAGDELRDPPALPAQGALPADAPAIAWKTAYEDHFDTQASVKKYLLVDGGDLDWSEKYKALFLKNDEGGGGQLYAAVHQSLPGDLRVRLKVLRPKNAEDINIGLLFSIRGALKAEDGYFAEIKGGVAQIKRLDTEQANAKAETPATPDRWVDVELSKIGGRIEIRLQGKSLLVWTDPHPLNDAQHDLFSLYVWNDRMLIDDLVIERNPADPVKPKDDDPADPQNAINGTRTNPADNPDQF